MRAGRATVIGSEERRAEEPWSPSGLPHEDSAFGSQFWTGAKEYPLAIRRGTTPVDAKLRTRRLI
jgi:hypothetical protein